MKFGKSEQEISDDLRDNYYKVLHEKFAWMPVKLDCGKTVWLENYLMGYIIYRTQSGIYKVPLRNVKMNSRALSYRYGTWEIDRFVEGGADDWEYDWDYDWVYMYDVKQKVSINEYRRLNQIESR